MQDFYEFLKGKALSLDSFYIGNDKKAIAYGHLYTMYREYIDNVELSSNQEGIMSKNGDILFPGSSTVKNGTCQSNAILLDNIMLGGDIIIAREKQNKKTDPLFMSYQINSHKKKLYPITTGTTITHMYGKDIKEIKYGFTDINEQAQIGKLFKTLDNLITCHQRKQVYLFIFEIINKHGNNNKFKFAWEQREFGSLVEIARGGSPRPIDEFITNDINGLNWVKIGDAPKSGNYITKTEEKIKPEGLIKTREVFPNDLILSNSMSFGKPYIMAIKGCIHDGWLLIRDNKNKFDLLYLCTMLGTEKMISQYKSLAAGSTVNNLNKELVSKTNISFPIKEEQFKIGKLFKTLDNLITCHQR